MLDIEYHLLKIYKAKGLNARWLLLKLAFKSYIELVEDKMAHEPQLEPSASGYENNKLDAQCFLQVDIISKLMMYSEDIAVFSTAFLNNTLFYKMLDPKKPNKPKKELLEDDLGNKIKSFYESLDNLSREQIYKIMSYKSEVEVCLALDDPELIGLTIKNMRANAVSIKRILSLVGVFGRTHHPFFKRFKHAGLPIAFNQKNNLNWDWLTGVDIINKAHISEEDPMVDPRVIPFSKKAFDSYFALFRSIDTLLKDMIRNRIASIELGERGIISRTNLDELCFSHEERRTWNTKIEQYYKKITPVFEQDPLPSKFSDDKFTLKDYEWYLKLDELLKEGTKMAEKINKEELFQTQVLVEDSNIKYANLKDEFESRGITYMSIQDCEEYLMRTLSLERSKKIMWVLEWRGYIGITNQNVILLKESAKRAGRHLDEEDKKFALALLNEFHEYAKICSSHGEV